ncbi:MAG: hypothetical protein IPK26_07245 [Planctomycetes bacterium]|nr:hypothetical protein [Planctomycetota bacterium]
MFAVPDGIWNHGEGFAAPGQADADHGGWFGPDDGTAVTSADVHTLHEWVPHNWYGPVHPSHNAAMRRFNGYLRPAGLALPTVHPYYGAVGPYVDQGAFELFRPNANFTENQKVLISIGISATQGWPEPGIMWGQNYLGSYSPDGLIRSRPGSQSAQFLANTVMQGPNGPTRYAYEQFVAIWPRTSSAYYPIVGYAVSTVAGRQTELVQQRCLQVVQAVKEMMKETSSRNPVGTARTSQWIEDNVFVVFAGGSNGGHQSQWAGVSAPHLVHGAFVTTINPSIQRLIGEQDLGYAMASLTGSDVEGADFDPIDMRNWGQYCWNRGYEMHDLSLPRRFVRGETYRPFLFWVGDEDITSTGTDWIRLLHGSQYSRWGATAATQWTTGDKTAWWSAAENTCHLNGISPDPFQGGQPDVQVYDWADNIFVQ